MAYTNTIELAKKYLPLLDEEYKFNLKTSDLELSSDLIQEAQNGKSVMIPKISLDGLGDYDRNNGFVGGGAAMSWETHTFSQDRGRQFQIDRNDNLETMDQAFLGLTGQFIRTKVVPEVDAYRFSQLATKAGTKFVGAALTTTANVVSAVGVALRTLDENEVPEEGRILYITPVYYDLLAADPKFQRAIVNGNLDASMMTYQGCKVVKVPQSRMYSAIKLNDGTTAGETGGGYTFDTTASDINFIVMHPTATMAISKTALPRIFTPEVNQNADAWKYDYHLYHDCFILENKTKGIYAHMLTARTGA